MLQPECDHRPVRFACTALSWLSRFSAHDCHLLPMTHAARAMPEAPPITKAALRAKNASLMGFLFLRIGIADESYADDPDEN
jgi:hypothetical protein